MYTARCAFQVGSRVYGSELEVFNDYMSPEPYGSTKFHEACRNKDNTQEVEEVLDCISDLALREKLITKKDDSTCTPLITSIVCRSKTALKLIEALGERAYTAITKQDNGSRSAWFYTIQHGDKDTVKACLSVANAQGKLWDFSTWKEGELPNWPPLHRAVAANNKDAIKLLLQANGTRAKDLVLLQDQAHESALYWARMNSKDEIVRLFESTIGQVAEARQ